MFDSLDVIDALAALDPKQFYVVIALFWGDLTETATAAELAELRSRPYTRNRVHRIKLTALAKMRRYLEQQAVSA